VRHHMRLDAGSPAVFKRIAPPLGPPLGPPPGGAR
jgi:hypothetical protein